jgi:hypothetical protein
MNQTIKTIREQLSKYKNIDFIEENNNSITIKQQSDNSFPITLLVKNNKYFVYFKGWYKEFSTEEEALDCFAYGLSADCRLKVISSGDVEYKWILEYEEKGQWKEDSEIGIALFPFWQKKHTTYFQNTIISHEQLKGKK